jgi:superfamily II DNA/RNA helicase
VHPSYDPYLHQLQAWQRLSSRDGAEPQATIVTTGTGSGKTECFLYPALDHCYRALQRGEGGIKAIILYPMNALAADPSSATSKKSARHGGRELAMRGGSVGSPCPLRTTRAVSGSVMRAIERRRPPHSHARASTS